MKMLQQRSSPSPPPSFWAGLTFLLATLASHAQDIEPRRWSHLPINNNFIGGGYAYTDGTISLDPVLRIEDAEFEMNSIAAKYIRSFNFFGKSGRVDLSQIYQSGVWSGKIDGKSASTERDGWADSLMRFSVNLYGAPPLEEKEFIEYRSHTPCETIIGAGLLVQLPTGEYFEDRLINLGTNHFTFTPQLGIVHTRDHWSYELSGSANFYTVNPGFFKNTKLEEEVYFTGQGHVIYTFRPGLWMGASCGYGHGGQASVNNAPSGEAKKNIGWGLSMGFSLSRSLSVKFNYIGTQTQQDTGADTNTFAVSCSYQW
jgi:Putative MetA-pathway of phenol degradation